MKIPGVNIRFANGFHRYLLTVNKIQELQTSFHRNDTCSVHTRANLLPRLAIYQVPAQAGIYCEASCFQEEVCQFLGCFFFLNTEVMFLHAFLENCHINFKSKQETHPLCRCLGTENYKTKKRDKTQKHLKTKSFNANVPALTSTYKVILEFSGRKR